MPSLTLGFLKDLQQQHNLPDETVILVPDRDHSYRGTNASVQSCYHLGGIMYDPAIPDWIRIGSDGKGMIQIPAIIVGE